MKDYYKILGVEPLSLIHIQMCIRDRNVTIAYQKHIVLEKVNLRIEKGMITTFLGPNGSGKTTLMSSINGTIKPREGNIFIHNRDVAKLKTKELARMVATVPQLYNSNFSFTVFDRCV